VGQGSLQRRRRASAGCAESTWRPAQSRILRPAGRPEERDRGGGAAAKFLGGPPPEQPKGPSLRPFLRWFRYE